MTARQATVGRQSKETEVLVSCNLDGSGLATLALPVGFLQHMLTAFAKHSRFDLEISASGDTFIDDHHLCEDTGLTLGRALRLAWQGKGSLCRFGQALVPMDEALAQIALDISGRPYLAWTGLLPGAKVGNFDSELVQEFMRALVQEAGITLHISLLSGSNTHHIIEAIFKALGLALRQATRLDLELTGMASSKGDVQWQER